MAYVFSVCFALLGRGFGRCFETAIGKSWVVLSRETLSFLLISFPNMLGCGRCAALISSMYSVRTAAFSSHIVLVISHSSYHTW